MILTNEKREIIKSAPIETHSINVKSPTVLFNILCDKTYQFPLTTMCQEYMCNARDAHREIDKNDKPIKVIIPTKLDQRLIIRDFGKGISPDRMKNVFIFLGESTKRNSNKQNGGFGIGAKIGFAYTDTFSITSRHQCITREYIAYKGEDQLGHIDLVNEYMSPIDEPDGVEISIPIKEEDIKSVQKAVVKCSIFWKTPPIIQNLDDHLTKIYDIRGDIPSSKMIAIPPMLANLLYDYVLYCEEKIIVVYDGCIYSTLVNQKGINTQFVIKNSALLLETGEVDIAVNREGLQYTPRTINRIKEIIKESTKKGIDTAKKEFIKSMDTYDLLNTSDTLKKNNSSVIVKQRIDVIWGHFDLTYHPGINESLSISLSKKWAIYEVNTRQLLGFNKKECIRNLSDNHNYYNYDYSRKKILLPLSSSHKYIFDDRNTKIPSPIMVQRWVEDLSSQNSETVDRYFIIKENPKHNIFPDESIQPLIDELGIDKLSRYVRKLKTISKITHPKKAFKLLSPINFSTEINNDEILEWIKDENNTLILVKKTSKSTAEFIYTKFIKGCSLIKSIYDYDPRDKTKLYLISNKKYLDKLYNDHDNVISFDEWHDKTSIIERNISYQKYKEAIDVMWKMESVIHRIKMDYPDRIHFEKDYYYYNDDYIHYNSNIIIALEQEIDSIKDPYIKSIVEFSKLSREFKALKSACSASSKGHKYNKFIYKRLPKSWHLDYSEFISWKIVNYTVLSLLSNTYNRKLDQCVSDLVQNYLNKER